MNKKIRAIGAAILVAVWVVLTALSWFAPPKEISTAERRELAQLPPITVQSLLDGTFMTEFEDYSLDQFPLRDRFRQLKSLFCYYVLNQKDNNQIYVADGYAAKMDYPLNQNAVDQMLKQYNQVYEKLLDNTDANIYVTVVPDKGYYLAEENGYLALNYEALFNMVQEQTPWGEYIDITQSLKTEDYYRTDTHWRQEKLLPVAEKIAQAMGVEVQPKEAYTQRALDRPFYGVHYGHGALPMNPETMYIMESELLEQCSVYSYTTNTTTAIYNMEKLTSADLYEVFLSGSESLLKITNPNAKTDRELIVFRDSYGSSLVPLLLRDYKSVTLVDIRYINLLTVKSLVKVTDQDVLFMYSSMVLNNHFAES